MNSPLRVTYGIKNAERFFPKDHPVCYLGFNFRSRRILSDSGFQPVDISAILEELAEKHMYDYIDYIAQIGKKQNDKVLWWSTSVASKSNLQNDLFQIIILLLAAEKLYHNGAVSNFIVDDHRVFYLLQKNFIIVTEWVSRFNILRKKIELSISRFLSYFLSRVLWFFRIINHNRKVKLSQKKQSPNCTYIYSWVEKRSFNESDEYSDPYMPGLDDIAGENSYLFLDYYVDPALYEKLFKLNYRVASLAYFSASWLLLKSFFKRLRPYGLGKVRFLNFDFSYLIRDQIKRENSLSIIPHRYYSYLCWKNFFKQSSGMMIFPFEGQPWEKVMLLAKQTVSSKMKTAGYQHSAVGKIQTSYYTTPEELKYIPQPDMIIGNATAFTDLFSEMYKDTLVKVLNGGSFRYSEPIKFVNSQIGNNEKVIGILASIDKGQTEELVYHLNHTVLPSGLRFMIKSHPNLPISRENLRPEIQLFEKSAKDLYAISDAILYTSGSSGIEAYSLGLPVFRFCGNFIDLRVGEGVFTPNVISSVAELVSFDLVKHDPVIIFPPANIKVWEEIVGLDSDSLNSPQEVNV